MKNATKTKTKNEPIDDVLKHIAIADINYAIANHRRAMDETKLQELADSIASIGVQQPIKVCDRLGKYIMIFGHRRAKASQLAGQDTVPAIVVTGWNDADIAEAQVVENIHREDLDPIEEAYCVKTLNEGGLGLDVVASKMNKSIDWCRERLDLLRLGEKIQTIVATGRLPLKQARLIARVGDKHDQISLATFAVGGHIDGRGDYVQPLKEIRKQISYILCKLGGAGWPKDVDYAKKRPCDGCVDNTNTEPALFEGVKLTSKRGNCTNPGCFETKATAWEKDPIKTARVAKRDADKKKNGTASDAKPRGSEDYDEREKRVKKLKKQFPWTPAQAFALAEWLYGQKVVKLIGEFIASGKAFEACRPAEMIVLASIDYKAYSTGISDQIPSLAEIVQGKYRADEGLAETWVYNAELSESSMPKLDYNGDELRVPLPDVLVAHIDGVEAVAYAWGIKDIPARPECETFVRQMDIKAVVKAKRPDAMEAIASCVDPKFLADILKEAKTHKLAAWRKKAIEDRLAELDWTV